MEEAYLPSSTDDHMLESLNVHSDMLCCVDCDVLKNRCAPIHGKYFFQAEFEPVFFLFVRNPIWFLRCKEALGREKNKNKGLT